MAFSASDLQLTHHWGFMTDSMKSPLLAQTGMLIGFSASPTYRPFFFISSTTLTRAWKRFMPSNSGPALLLSVPSSLRMLMNSSWCRMPTS